MACTSKSTSSSEESLHFDVLDNEFPAREWSPFDPDELHRQLAEQRQREAEALQALEQQFVTPPKRSPLNYDDDENLDDLHLGDVSDDEQQQQQQLAEGNINREAVPIEGRQAVHGPPRRCVRRLSFSEFAPQQQPQSDLKWTPRAAAKIRFSDKEPGVYNYGPFDKHEENSVKSVFKSCFYPFYALARCFCQPKVDPEDCNESLSL